MLSKPWLACWPRHFFPQPVLCELSFLNRTNSLAVLYPARDKIAGMLEIIELLIHYLVTLIKLLKPGGVKVVMAESIAIKHQLIVMNRSRKRSIALVTKDRFLFGLLTIKRTLGVRTLGVRVKCRSKYLF